MKATPRWVARAWLPYSLSGVLWLMIGALVLGAPQGLGLVFVGLTCLSLGLSGALWRTHHGYGLLRAFPQDPMIRCQPMGPPGTDSGPHPAGTGRRIGRRSRRR